MRCSGEVPIFDPSVHHVAHQYLAPSAYVTVSSTVASAPLSAAEVLIVHQKDLNAIVFADVVGRKLAAATVFLDQIGRPFLRLAIGGSAFRVG